MDEHAAAWANEWAAGGGDSAPDNTNDATVASVAPVFAAGTGSGSLPDTDVTFPAHDEPGSGPVSSSTADSLGPLLVALVVVGVVGAVLGLLYLRRSSRGVAPAVEPSLEDVARSRSGKRSRAARLGRQKEWHLTVDSGVVLAEVEVDEPLS